MRLLTQKTVSSVSEQRHSPQLETVVLASLVLLKFLFQYWLVNAAYDLHRDEYLHLDQANHLAAGYLSVPPFTSWVAWCIKALGNSVFWVRFFPALFGVLTMVVVWQTVQELGGGLYAKALAATGVLFSAMLRLNMLFQPNSVDVLAFTLVFYLLIKFVRTKNNSLLLWLGLTVGLGLLNKYNLVFLLIGLVPALLLSPHRGLFLNRWLYAAIVLAALVVLPNVIWQFSHGLPVIHHMQELNATQLQHVNRLDFWQDQLLFFFGALFVVLGAFVGLAVYPPLRPYRFVGWAYLFTMLLFTYLRAKNYYAFGLYPVLLAVGSAYWEHLFQQGWKRYTRPFWLALPLLLFLPIINVAFPLLSPKEIQAKAEKFKRLNLLKWEDGKDHSLPQDFADMLGWQELTRIVEKAYQKIPEVEKSYTLILCDNYGQAGAINFYGNRRLPAAVSFNADYAHWYPMELHLKNIILVKTLGEAPLKEEEKSFFKSVTKIGEIRTEFAREQGTDVYLLQGVAPEMEQRLKERAREKQKEW